MRLEKQDWNLTEVEDNVLKLVSILHGSIFGALLQKSLFYLWKVTFSVISSQKEKAKFAEYSAGVEGNTLKNHCAFESLEVQTSKEI